jgi:hypothetical protein
MIDWFITVSVITRRDDEHETTVKWNDGDEWSFDDVVFWLVRMQNGDTVKWWESGQG